MIHRAKDLSPDQKAAQWETLPRRHVLEHERRLCPAPRATPLSGDDRRRQEIQDELRRYPAGVDAASPQPRRLLAEADGAVVEGGSKHLPSYRPHQ